MGRINTALMVWLAVLPVAGEELFTGVAVDEGVVVRQQLYEDSSEACGPAAMANALRFGTQGMSQAADALVGNDERTRLRFLIDRYFRHSPSEIFPGAKRLGHNGVLAVDLRNAFNDLLKENHLEPVTLLDLNRLDGERDRDFLWRVHGRLQYSLKRGVPPIIQLRSYAAMQEEEGNDKVAWKTANNHFLVVTRVPTGLRKQDMGFAFDAIDPNGGRLVAAYVFGEKHLPFKAEKAPSGPAPAEWLSGRPFLLVKAPGVVSLQPRNAIWRDRVIVTLSAVIGRF